MNSYNFGDALAPQEAMSLSIDLAEKAVGYVSPNPPVGCVILNKKSELIGLGYHEKHGDPHAEVNAINSVKDKAQLREAKIFVTLEPCAHHGKTPPCCDLIKDLPVSEVVYALADTNPLVEKKGLKLIKDKGIKVTQYIFSKKEAAFENKLNQMMAPFFHNMKTKKPFVALKVASSADGMIALSSGESQWITGEKAREHVHLMRAKFDAILVGAGTVLADNPKLNIRHKQHAEKTNKVIILDAKGELLNNFKSLNLYKTHKAEDIYYVTKNSVKKLHGLGVNHMWSTCSEGDEFDLNLLLLEFYSLGMGSIFIEGGAAVYKGFLAQKQVQKFYLYLGAKILGADGSLSWSKELKTLSLSNTIDLKFSCPALIGGDLFIEADF